MFAHIEQKGWQYVIRVKDVESIGIASSLKMADKDEIDQKVNLVLTRKQTNEVKAQSELYKFLKKKSPFDFVDLHKNKFYPMTFRVVKFKISENTYETLITNLLTEDFSSEELKALYYMRWGIETLFRELKYALGLTSFHAKKMTYITQEVFERLVIYNFSLIITLNVTIEQKNTKHIYQVNFTVAIQICKRFIRRSMPTTHVEALIKKNILPIRKNRKDSRKIKFKSAISFLYGVA